MTYDALGPGALDYLPCRYGTSKLLFRGPRRSLQVPYVAFVGGTETYGKFIETPFPALIEEQTNITSVNFGYPNAGIDVFSHDSFITDAAARAKVTVIQVMGAQNMTNRFYSVHPRRNDRFVAASRLLNTIYRDVDFAEFHFNKHMLGRLKDISVERFDTVRLELQEAWMARMRLMLGQMRGKTILLWFAQQPPLSDEQAIMTQDGLGYDPLFITREMINEIAPFATKVVEVVSTPQSIAAGTDGMIFSELESMSAAELMGPIAHEKAAAALLQALEPML